jgi:hypothetical protein
LPGDASEFSRDALSPSRFCRRDGYFPFDSWICFGVARLCLGFGNDFACGMGWTWLVCPLHGGSAASGYGLDLSLTGVEKADGYLPVRGGMRLGFTPREDEASLLELHAGDEISVRTEARLPMV